MKYAVLLIFLVLLAISCERKPDIISEEKQAQYNHEDFNSFWAHFKTDSIFQIERIKFPLPL